MDDPAPELPEALRDKRRLAEDEDFGRVAYFDTGDVAGVVMELVEPYDHESE